MNYNLLSSTHAYMCMCMNRHTYSEKVHKIASWKNFSLPLTSGNFLASPTGKPGSGSPYCLMEEGPKKAIISHSRNQQ